MDVLSGGERARVALARLLIKPGNLLLMDEPTNHLDLESADALAESLSGFDGTVLFVSHNRSFVRRLATKIWNVEGGTVEVYPGSMDDYMESSLRRLEGVDEVESAKLPSDGSLKVGKPKTGGSKPNAKPKAKGQPTKAAPAAKRDRASKKEEARKKAEQRKKLAPLRKKVDALEAEVAKLEAEQRERSVALSDPATYEDAERRHSLTRAYQDGQAKLEELNDAWEMAVVELEDAESE